MSTFAHCKNGHPFTPDNTRISPRGSRFCKTCHRDYQREWSKRPKEVA